MNTTDVIVIGGGIAGLVAAHRLKKSGISVLLLEADKTLGGKVQTAEAGDDIFDVGANTVLESNTELVCLIDELGLRSKVLMANSAVNVRFILKNNFLVPLPTSLLGFLTTSLFSASAKLRLLKEPFIERGAGEETIAEFVVRRFGREILDYAVNPFLAGTYAARPEDLSAHAAFKLLYELESEFGSVIGGIFRKKKEKRKEKSHSGKMFSFAGGLYEVVASLRDALSAETLTQAQAVSLQPRGSQTSVRYLHRGEMQEAHASAVVIATEAHAASTLIEAQSPELAVRLKEIQHSPVAQVFLSYEKSSVQLPSGFGFLVPERENKKILGAVFNHFIFPQRYRHAVCTVFIGGSRQPELVLRSEAELIALAQEELRLILRIDAKPVAARIVKWDRAIPQYRIGHNEILSSVSRFEAGAKTVFFTGNWRGGISIPDTVKHAEETALRVIETLRALPND